MAFLSILLYKLVFLAVVQGVQSALDLKSPSNVAAYWGQGSGKTEQKPLGVYCDNPNIDVIQLAFVTAIEGAGGAPVMDFSTQSHSCPKFPGTQLPNCPQIGADIKKCQSQGKTVLMSIGGSTWKESYPTPDAATKAAQKLWDTVGPVNKDVKIPRPFGDAVVDGFDFDYETKVTNLVPAAEHLRQLADSDKSKKFYLTAAPQCVYPDAMVGDMLNNVALDAIWVQFYNNKCGIQSFVPGQRPQPNFTMEQWDGWAKGPSKNKDVRVFVGVPGSKAAATSGYMDPEALVPLFNFSKSFSSFGGVMIWDVSAAYSNGDFVGKIKHELTG